MPTPGLIHEWVVDAYGCAGDLSDIAHFEKIAREALEKIGATVAAKAEHKFQPHGVTLCLILKESHFIVSTWPEHRMMIVNIFLCNPRMNPSDVWEHFAREFRPSKVNIQKVAHLLADKLEQKQAA